MRVSMIIRLLAALTELLTPDMIRGFFLAGVSWLKAAIEKTPNQIDDALCLGILNKIAEILSAPEKTE